MAVMAFVGLHLSLALLQLRFKQILVASHDGFIGKALHTASGISFSQMREGGLSAAQLKAVGANAAQLKAGGFDAAQLKAVGFNARARF